jgi:hypothetical protein
MTEKTPALPQSGGRYIRTSKGALRQTQKPTAEQLTRKPVAAKPAPTEAGKTEAAKKEA